MTWAKLWIEMMAPVAEIPPARQLAIKYAPLVLFAVVLAVLLVKAVRVWQEIHDVEEPATPGELLASLEGAHAAGELDDAEIERVRQQLVGGQTNSGPSVDEPPSHRNIRALP
jgi:hypothetical protein